MLHILFGKGPIIIPVPEKEELVEPPSEELSPPTGLRIPVYVLIEPMKQSKITEITSEIKAEEERKFYQLLKINKDDKSSLAKLLITKINCTVQLTFKLVTEENLSYDQAIQFLEYVRCTLLRDPIMTINLTIYSDPCVTKQNIEDNIEYRWNQLIFA